ncbi:MULTISPECIES: LysR family transcriptional regulator [Mammaliicoccus]|uniref:LysR family transcriptional regulator n=1 Tax=Mammaliicoccus vitulinus TaxID=71237 RepID=A0ABX7HGE8_9STAP|nr:MULTISPECIES: LysR family transcriptional regulator [Mammaliicoccus]HAL08651.1 LysR family transcriptional regulator [Staphylococcus sp.]PNZ35681.1 LysR family transcriptional regulator [Mammaliicoccus vitulinus]PTI37693.1 LysR family transcriptional regulator [Mammaliicoccus vitulinus]PTI71896.1 LysR family transcriptional regulator [Mammaliicoccus vitulinus]QQT15359.1 LysR family transcriptional regulator [Mammaliicoccus vitulinus]
MDSMDWEILRALFKYKNITQTSKILRISQPAVTYRINKLEEEFNVDIINRNQKGVVFTSPGEIIVKYALSMIKDSQKLKEELINQENKVQGTLRLSASSIFSRYQLPKILSEFSQKYPLVEFDVNTGWSEEVFKSVHNDYSQVGILRGDYSFSSEKIRLMTEKIYIVSKHPISIDDLPHLPRIYYNTDTSLNKLIDDWWIGRFVEPSSIAIKVDNMETSKEFVQHGLGFSILPDILLKNNQDLHKIPCLDQNGNAMIRNTDMILKEQYLSNNVVRAFYNFMKERKLEFD